MLFLFSVQLNISVQLLLKRNGKNGNYFEEMMQSEWYQVP